MPWTVRAEPWMPPAMQARYDFPVHCHQQKTAAGSVAA
jgi:hypothetical protein